MIRNALSPPVKSPVYFSEPSLTKQSFRDDCNINVIMARFTKTGVVNHINPLSPLHEDFSGAVSYQEALHQVMAGDAAFMSLPSKLRSRFHNNPAEYLDFVADPSNTDEMVSLGLAIARPPVESSDVLGGTTTPVSAASAAPE